MSTLVKIHGIHAVQSILEHHPHVITRLLILSHSADHSALQSLAERATQHSIRIEPSSRAMLDQESQNGVHQGVLAFCKTPPAQTESELEFFLDRITHPPVFLVLDQVQDPHNLGACFRSANALGADAIIVPKNNSCGLTPVVYKTASGAALLTPFFQVTNLARTLDQLKTHHIWIYGLAAEARANLHQISFESRQGIALVLGAEGSGLRRLTREQCDELLYIPMRGQVSSLNVSVATGIALAEIMRQKNEK